MSMLSVKNLDEKAFNYAVITVTPEAPLHCLVLTCLMVPGTSWSATKATIMEIFGLQRSSPIQLNT